MSIGRRSFLKSFCVAKAFALGGVGVSATPIRGQSAPATAEPFLSGKALKVALMQAAAFGHDQQRNLNKADAFCRQAAAAGADLLVMPEMWSIGYLGFGSFDKPTAEKWQKNAIPTEGPWVAHFKGLARQLRMAIAVTYLQQWEGAPRNAVTVFDRNGRETLTYAKVHTCDFAFEAAMTPGDGWKVAELDTAKGSVEIGAMICFDREFPESARSLMARGAELVITPNACRLDDLRIDQFRVRAYENAFAVAMANYSAPMMNGRSVSFDASANRLVEAGDREGLYYANIDLEALRDYRRKTLWGGAWRKPGAYQDLLERPSLQEFQRVNAFGEPSRS